MLCMISRRILSFAHCFLYSVCAQITSSYTNIDFSQCELCVIYVTYLWWQLDNCMTKFPEFFRYSVLTSVEVLADVHCFCEVFCCVQNYEIMPLLHK